MNTTSSLSVTPGMRSNSPDFPVFAPALCFMLADFLVLLSVLMVALWGTRSYLAHETLLTGRQLAPFCLIFLAILFLQDLYPGFLLHPAEEIRRVSMSIFVGSIGFLCVLVLTYHPSGVHILLLGLIDLLAIPLVLVTRSVVRHFLSNHESWGSSAILVGSEFSTRRILRSLKTTQPHLQVLGVLTDADPDEWDASLPPILGGMANAPSLWNGQIAQYAVVTMPDASDSQTRKLIDLHSGAYRRLIFAEDLCGVGYLDIDDQGNEVEIRLDEGAGVARLHQAFAKRTFDFAFSATLILLVGPIWIVVAALVLLSSPGKILFSHTRAGRKGKQFRAFKFRTMVSNSDEVLKRYLAANPLAYQEWLETRKLKRDPRMTPVGAFLRRYSIDELPQLFNVLRGEMSIVGPRPIVEDEVHRYGATFELYKSVSPGLTGLWQVSGRNNTSYPQRVAFDEYYVRNWSVWMDLYILSRTLKAVVGSEGAY